MGSIGVSVRALRVFEHVVRRHGAAPVSVAVEDIVDPLNEERVHFHHFLATDPERELRRRGVSSVEAFRHVGTSRADFRIFDPDVIKQITLTPDRNGDLLVRAEGADKIQSFRLHTEVSVSPIILSPKRNFWSLDQVAVLFASADQFN